MSNMKDQASCVGLLADVVGSRHSDRTKTHRAILHAIKHVNKEVPALDDLRVTVGDELQGVYVSLGDALHARLRLAEHLLGTVDLRFGLGGGEVRVVDASRHIQDGSAWWLAREAIERVETYTKDPGYRLVRTAILDERTTATPCADSIIRLIETTLARLRDGTRRSLNGVLAGLTNIEVAAAEGISASANSQRVNHNDLRVLADAIAAVQQLP